MRPQATRIEPQQPATSTAEKVGCLGVILLFAAMLGTVYAIPYAIAWAVGVI